MICGAEPACDCLTAPCWWLIPFASPARCGSNSYIRAGAYIVQCQGTRGMADCQAPSPCAPGGRLTPPVPDWRDAQNRKTRAAKGRAMPSLRKSLFGVLVRLTMIPLSLPCLIATCCCCSVAFGSSEAHCQSPGEGVVLSLGGPQNSLPNGGVHSIDSNGLAGGTTEAPNRCCCCPVNSDAKRPLVVRRSTQHRAKVARELRSVLHTGNTVSSSSAVGSRSSVSARAASCPTTSAENCILLCRLLL